MIILRTATLADIPIIQSLSKIVWPVTFADILSPHQIDYMMGMMYSDESLTKQMTIDQHQYTLAQLGEDYVGYLSTQSNIDNSYTKIHKIYVLPHTQGLGVGKRLLSQAKKLTEKAGNSTLRLNVNRYNKALDFYQHLGFSIAYTEDIDIGNGFLMEDYVMEMSIK